MMAVQTDVERLARLLDEATARHTFGTSQARYLIDHGVTFPPAPVDPAWMEEAVRTATASQEYQHITRESLRALLAAGYRIVPPTQDRAAVEHQAARALTKAMHCGRLSGAFTEWPGALPIAVVLYDAGMLVAPEGDGR